MCSMSYLEPVRMAVLCLLPCREHQRNGKREGLAVAVSTQSVVYTVALVLPLLVFPCVFVSEACSVGKGFLNCLFSIDQNGLPVFFILKQLCHLYTCKWVCGEYACCKSCLPKSTGGFFVLINKTIARVTTQNVSFLPKTSLCGFRGRTVHLAIFLQAADS